MKIEILGTGCPKCQKLAAQVESAANKLGLQYELVKVTDIGKITEYGVMITPALVIDGRVRTVGKVPGQQELERLLQQT